MRFRAEIAYVRGINKWHSVYYSLNLLLSHSLSYEYLSFYPGV